MSSLFSALSIVAVLAGISVIFTFLMPAVFIPSWFGDSLHALGSYLALWNLFFPLSEWSTMIIFTVGFVFANFSLRLVLYVVAQLRGNAMPSK